MAGDEIKTITEPKAASVKVFNCPSCGAGVVLRAVGQSITAVCGSCGAIIDSSNENYKVIDKASRKGNRDQVIPLGQRGKLRGILWEVIGYVERSDETSVYTWSEYLLFNPMNGFRWLTESAGHWNYIIMTKSQPEVDSSSSMSSYGRKMAKYLNKRYFLFNQGSAKVIYVVGEFYWQVKQGETVEVEDYVFPPEILSSEKSKNEIIWSIGEYVDADTVKLAFQISKPMPVQTNVAPNQPSTVTEASNYSGKYWASFVGILFVIQFAMMFLSKNETVYSGQLLYNSVDTDKLKVSPQFELKHGVSNLEVTISAPVQNNWVEVQSDLVNDDNGETQDFEQGVEYYFGNDSEGSWSEGDQTNTLVLSSVPEGKYHLNIEASGPALPTTSTSALEEITTPVNAVNKTEIWQNGNLKSVEPMVNGKIEGVAKYYFESGKLNSEIPYKNGKKYGKYKVYREDGTMEQTGANLGGKLNGNVKWYDASGNVIRDVYYSDGVQVPSSSINTHSSFPINVVVKRGVTTWSNFLWAIFLISIYPAFVLWRNRSFEMNRWSQSDFSPYSQHKDDD